MWCVFYIHVLYTHAFPSIEWDGVLSFCLLIWQLCHLAIFPSVRYDPSQPPVVFALVHPALGREGEEEGERERGREEEREGIV